MVKLEELVMSGFMPGIHVLGKKTWMAGSSPAMTKKRAGAPVP
jgi:hypothetical protein